jgi:hypothetical protein
MPQMRTAGEVLFGRRHILSEQLRPVPLAPVTPQLPGPGEFRRPRRDQGRLAVSLLDPSHTASAEQVWQCHASMTVGVQVGDGHNR